MTMACANDFAAVTCNQFRYAVPASCRIKGTLDDDSVCENDRQCKSGYCKGSFPCGTCKPRPAEIVGAAKGQPCTVQTCALPYQCVGGSCVDPLQENAACTEVVGSDDGCDTTKGLNCIDDKCTKEIFPGPGEACGFVDGGGRNIVCRGDATCENGKCVARAGDGADCSVDGGPECALPAECIAAKCGEPAADRCK